MSGEMAASLVLKFNDQGSGSATSALQKVSKAMKETGEVAKSASSAAISAYQKLSNARETLGIRSEKAIQNEIRQTEAAYKRLSDSGQAGAMELGRAHDAMRQKVADLRREMDGVKKSADGIRSASGGAQALRFAMGAYAGIRAGGYVLSEPIRQTMAYDRQLANLSNTAFAGASLNDRRTGMRTLDSAIMAAVRSGGGTREGALSTLDRLVASGAFPSVGEATGLLPILSKAGTAANADPSQLADIAIRAKQTFGLTDTGRALDQAIKAGQLGGFELKDMAKWLPQQMAMARMSGLKGDDGFRTLLAANQAAAITAGTKDEAGNNLVNLLQKINSQDTANDAKKMGINLSGTLAAARSKGVNSLDAFVNLTEQIVAKDKNFVALRDKARRSSGDEQRATFESMGDILQGSAIGKIVQDRQALMSLVGIMGNRGYMNDIRGQLSSAEGTTANAFSLIAETPSFKAEQLAAEKANSLQTALDKINPALGQMADYLTNAAREYPVLSAAVTGATLALGALAATAGGAALPGILMRTGASGAAGASVGAIAAGGGVGLSAAARIGGLATAPLAAMWGVKEWAEDQSNDNARTQGLIGFSGSVSRFLGMFGFNKEAEWDRIRKRNQGEVEEPTGQQQPIVVEVKLDGRQVAEAVNIYNARDASRH